MENDDLAAVLRKNRCALEVISGLLVELRVSAHAGLKTRSNLNGSERKTTVSVGIDSQEKSLIKGNGAHYGRQFDKVDDR